MKVRIATFFVNFFKVSLYTKILLCCLILLCWVLPYNSKAQFLKFKYETIGFLEGLEYPNKEVFSSDQRYLYTSSNPGLSVLAYNNETGQIATIQVVRLDILGSDNYAFELFELSVDEKYLYAIANSIYSNEEFHSKLFVFERDQTSGLLKHVIDYPLNRNLHRLGDIKISPDGRHLYVTAFGIRTYEVNTSTGELTYKDIAFVGDTHHVWISPDGKFFYNEASTYINVYSRDIASGSLTHIESDFSIPRGLRAATKDGTLLFIYNVFEGGITLVRRNTVTGKLTKLGVHKNPIIDPNFTEGPVGIINIVITGEDEFLHVLAKQAGNITSYQINKSEGTLTLLDTKNGKDYFNGPLYLSMSADEKFFYVSAFNQDDLSLAKYTQNTEGVLQFVDSTQSGASLNRGLYLNRASVLSNDGKFLYVLSPGDSCITAFNTDHPDGSASLVNKIHTGDLDLSSYLDNDKFVLSPDNNFLYLLNAPSKNILAFQRNNLTGEIAYIGSTDLPETPNEYTGRIKFSPNGKFAYVLADGNDLLVYTRNEGTGTLTYAFTLNEYDGIPFKTIRDIAISNDNKNLYLVGNLFENKPVEQDKFINYLIDTNTGTLQAIQDSTESHENCHQCMGTDLTVTDDGMNVFVYHADIGFAYLDVFVRDPITGMLNFQRVQSLIMDRFQISYDGQYLLAGNTEDVKFYKRDLTDSGKLIYLGKQKPAGANSTFYHYNRIETYHFKPDNKTVVAVRKMGSIWTYSYENKFPPSPPIQLSLVNEVGRIVLHWKKNFEADIVSYEVFKSINDDPRSASKIGETIDITFLYAIEDAPTYFWVKAKNSDGIVSEFSNGVYGYGLNAPPGIPSGLVGLSGDKFISITWNANTESDIREYLLYRSLTNDNSASQLVNSTTSLSYQDPNVEYGVAYFYWVKALDWGGLISEFSTGVSGIPVNQPPAIPQNLNGFQVENSVNLTWTHNTEEDFKRYKLYRNTIDAYESSNHLADIEENSYSDATQDFLIYYYWLKAEDEAGNQSEASAPVRIERVITGVIDQEHSISIHPNPANKFITIGGLQHNVYSFCIINSTGDVILNRTASSPEINVSEIKAGLYILKINTKGQTLYYRFIKLP
jgi:6-phosphogluconolactonase (cycloisomerase 2 family)/fibronectin type 3 domain-containing protein